MSKEVLQAEGYDIIEKLGFTQRNGVWKMAYMKESVNLVFS